MTGGQHVRELRSGYPERDDECQVEQQLERRSRPMRLVGVAARHPAESVRERRAGLVASRFAHPDILTLLKCGSSPTQPQYRERMHLSVCTILPMPLVSGATAA